MRVLIADDDPLQAMVLSGCLAKWGHEVLSAADGAEAWRLFQQHPDIALVVTDWLMPGLDGAELIRRIRADQRPGYVYVILLTALDSREHLIGGMEAGADDFLVKPFDREELRVRLRAGERVVRLEQDLAHRNHELEAANRRMQRDLNAAAAVQRALLPAALLDDDGVRFRWAFRPCDELAGDMLGVVPLDGRHTALYVLDVSGHGVPAALLSVSVGHALCPPPTSSLLWRAERGQPGGCAVRPAEVAAELNRHFPVDPETGQFFTLLYGVLDRAARTFRYASAGHPGPAHLRADGAPVLLEAAGLPVGLAAPAAYREWEVALRPGDRLYLHSDGILEARNPAGEALGERGLVAALQAARGVDLGESLAHVLAAAERWCEPARLQDDVSLLAVEVGPAR
ncbi:MAG: SpoIIE family protein phosphatase [Gemmataceae bacterium]|nr:SpoIIE family protein phosphatase [Gemmataceae bacterium]